MIDSAISCTVDLDRPGRQVGRLQVPRSDNDSGWASTFVPIGVVSRGAGPTVLVLGGTHGDEYEGQIAGLRLLQNLRPDQVTGRVVVIPCLSPDASRAGTRLWPSGANFNRSFPGRPAGAAHEQLADFVSRALFPISDAVIDIHSGGRSARFIPCSHMHVVPDADQRRRMLDAMMAWNTDHHFLYVDIAGSGLLPVDAERMGKVVVTTELGGGGSVPAAIHALAHRGLVNVLRHLGVLEGQVETRVSLGLPPAVILDGRDTSSYLMAPDSGLFEAVADPGEGVTAGQLLGRLHFLEWPDRPPEVVEAPHDGVVVGVRAITSTRQGDVVVTLGRPIEASAVLNDATPE